MNIVQKPKFNWKPFEEDIFITGKKGEGKTTRCKRILDLIKPTLPYWIWSPQRPVENYGQYGHVVREINQMQYGQYVYAGNDWSDEAFTQFLRRAMNQRNLVLVLDDLHERVTKRQIVKELRNLVLSGRNRGISSIYITTTPRSVPNEILGNVSHVFAYPFVMQVDVEWLEKNLLGNDAWILISKDKRKYFQDTDIDVLPSRSYVYRNQSDYESQIVVSGNVQ